MAPNDGVDIGKGAGVEGLHVFINSAIGDYIDHMKGKRKIKGKSSKIRDGEFNTVKKRGK